MITVLDLGNNNVKGITEGGTPISFRSNLSRDYEAYPDGFNYVLLNGEYTFFEKGTFNREYIKTNKDYTAQLLYGLAKLYPNLDKIKTNLTLLLPISEMPHSKKYEDELKGKEFNFLARTNIKRDMNIKIDDVRVLPEGHASFFTLNDKEKEGNVLIVDIGGGTTNIIAMDYGKPQVLETFKIGILDFYSRLQNLNADKKYKLEDIEKAIKRGDIKVNQKDLAAFLNDVINQFNRKAELSQYDVKFTGGGSIVLKDIIEKNLPAQCVIMNDPLYSNVKGALEVSKIFFKGQEQCQKVKEKQ